MNNKIYSQFLISSFITLLFVASSCSSEEALDKSPKSVASSTMYESYRELIRQSFMDTYKPLSKADHKEINNKRVGDFSVEIITEYSNEQLDSLLYSPSGSRLTGESMDYIEYIGEIAQRTSIEEAEDYDAFFDSYYSNPFSAKTNLNNFITGKPESIQSMYIATIAYLDEVALPMIESTEIKFSYCEEKMVQELFLSYDPVGLALQVLEALSDDVLIEAAGIVYDLDSLKRAVDNYLRCKGRH